MAKIAVENAAIRIDDEYRIEIDPLNHTLLKCGVSNSGKEWTRPIGYFSNTANALKAYRDLKCLTAGECESIEEYIHKIEKIDGDVFQHIKSIVR